MEKKDAPGTDSRRQKAEEHLKKKQSEKAEDGINLPRHCHSIADHLEVIHELEVFQIELEMQNQELQLALENAATATALYDYSPAGYFTLESDGKICELNLNGARMLGKERSELVNRNFMKFVTSDTLDVFQDFLKKAVKTDFKQICEVKLDIGENSSIYIHLEGFVSIIERKCLVTAIDISDRKKNEETIFLSESRLRRAELASKTGNWEFHIDSKVIYASEGAIKLYGVDKGTFEYTDIKKITLQEYRPMLDLAMKNLLECNIPYNVEFKIRTQDSGEIKDIHSIATFDKEKRILFGSIQDITERKHMEDRLHESEQYYRTIVETSPDAIVIVDTSGELKFASQRAYDIFFLPSDHPIGSSFFQWIAPDMLELTIARFKSILSDEIKPESYEYKILRNDGKLVWVEIRGSKLQDIDGNAHGMLMICRDSTERKRAEQALQLAHDELKNLHDNLDEAVFSFDFVHNKMLQASQAHESIFGYPPSEFYKNPQLWNQIIIPEDKTIIDAGLLILSSGQNHKYEFRVIRPDGQLRWIASRMRPTLDKEGKLVQVDGIAYDITEHKHVQAELIAAKEKAEESDRLKSAFLANMSHEIRTPLNSIIGFSELMSDPEFDREQDHQFAQIINASGNNLLTIISDIMDISKIEAGQVEVKKRIFSVNQLMYDLQKEYSFKALDRGIELILDPSNPSDVYIDSDQTKIRQILVNLVGNSIKFTEKGFIELGMRFTENYLEFHVKDTGIGISAEFQAQIFERFRQIESPYTRKYGGTGLGLAISKSLTELLGGTLWLKSEQGKGSTFYFKIPLQSEFQ
jgi:PAS domain S-box-containing protein